MRRIRSGALAAGLLIVGMALGISIAREAPPMSAGTEAAVIERSSVDLRDEGEAPPASEVTTAGPAAPATNHESPQQAAIRFLELTEDVVRLSPDEGAQVQRSIASSEAADRLSADVFDLLRQLETDVPEGVEVHLAPLGLRTDQTESGWDVAIWYVEVIVYADELAVEQWRTATYSLVDENGEWRMDALESSDGPVPIRPASVVGWSAPALITAVADFDDEELLP